MIAACLAALLAFQDPPPVPTEIGDVSWDELQTELREEENEVVYHIRGLLVEQSGEDDEAFGRVRAGRAELVLDLPRYLIATNAPAAADLAPLEPVEPRRDPTLAARWNRSLLQALAIPEQEGLLLRLTFEEDVLLEGRELSLRCSTFAYDAEAGTTLARDADLRFARGTGPGGWPLRILASTIEESPDGSLHALDASLTTCDIDSPHYELKLHELHGRPLGDEHWEWSPGGASLAIGGRRILPLPAPDFTTQESFLALQHVELQSNSRMGQAIEIEVGGTSRDDRGDGAITWGLRPGFSTRRGVPLGASLKWSRGLFEADWDLFYLDDQASDVHPFSKRVGRDGDSRWRVRADHRYTFDEHWRADLDLVFTSDLLVDPEFFSTDWRSSDDAAPELYVRRLGESTLLDFSLSSRLDDPGFTPLEGLPARPGAPAPRQLDTLPLARFDRFSKPLFSVPLGAVGGADGEADVMLSFGIEAGRLRLRDQDLPPPPGGVPFASTPTLTRNRVRGFAEVALPLHAGGWTARPGARVRVNAYDEDLAGSRSVSRSQVEGFLEVGSLWVKKWEHGWQHRVLPQVRFRSAGASGDRLGLVPFFGAGDRSAQSPSFDHHDRLQGGQVVEFSLRQLYHAPGAESPWVDIDFLLPFYPDPERPLDDGLFPAPKRRERNSHWGPGEVRLFWTPGTYGKTLEGVRVETRVRQDFHQGRLDELFTRVSIEPDDGLQYGAAWRKVDDRFSVGQFLLDWRFSTTWALSVEQPFVFTGRAGRQTRVSLLRYEHDFVFEIGVARDTSQGDTGFFFNLIPRFLIDNAQGTRSPRMNR